MRSGENSLNRIRLCNIRKNSRFGRQKIEEADMTKKQLALEIIRRLKEAYPDAGCTLDYDEHGNFW